ncbi:MAG: hypothetical protein DMF77_19415 [Acidobacteria bacterium]|nr:MAG: hypothetical protein DMF77_19415 [Acidobacteriota bacterium]
MLGAGARLALAGLAFFICFAVSFGLLMPAVPPDPTAAASPIPPALAPLVVTALDTAVMAWLILRSRLRGWLLAAIMTGVLFGVQTLMPQVESWIFQAYSGYAKHLPAEMIPRIMMAGLVHACLWTPLAVLILGRWRTDVGSNSAPRPTASAALGSGKLAVAAATYVLVYFLFGYYVAWQSPAVREYYQGTDPGNFWVQMWTVLRDTPWLPGVQLLRGAAWTVLGVTVLRSMDASLPEKAVAVGALFAVVMCSGLLLPNPYMPYDVRMTHLLETAPSNFLFGLLVAWLFGHARPAAVDLRASA